MKTETHDQKSSTEINQNIAQSELQEYLDIRQQRRWIFRGHIGGHRRLDRSLLFY